jgi:broad specificity phosphatase PhoE
VRLLLARHGQSLWNQVRKFQGAHDVGLSDLGRTQAAALREAQVALWRRQRWSAPFYWAAFVLQGELR